MVNFLYDGGFLAARAIDERIVSATGGASGLIDVIRRLYIGDSGGREIGLTELEGAILVETGSPLSAFIEAVLDDPLADAPRDVSS
jgi:hypothetical protein